jgi:hypothetical protein
MGVNVDCAAVLFSKWCCTVLCCTVSCFDVDAIDSDIKRLIQYTVRRSTVQHYHAETEAEMEAGGYSEA